MQDPPKISKEARELANALVTQRRLSLRQLQLGYEWCARNKRPLIAFLERFCLTEQGAGLDPAEHDNSGPGRRLFARHEIRKLVWIEVDNKIVEVSTLNLSRGGIAFNCGWTMPVGAKIRVGIEQRVRALIRYCVDNGQGSATTGAEFAPRSAAEIQGIESLLVMLSTDLKRQS